MTTRQQAAVEFVLLCSGIALAVCWLLRVQ
jgi:hypothetical protein